MPESCLNVLARRPMLAFALAVAAGVLAARFRPEISSFVPYGLALFVLLAAWFCFSPKRPPAVPASLPEEYAPHILPHPGYVAGRGLGRFMLIACLGFFLVAAMRQDAWQAEVSPGRLPEQRWFHAAFLALAPSYDYDGQTGFWRVPAVLLSADGLPAGDVTVRLSGPEGPRFRRGDIIQARVRREASYPASFPGAFDFNLWLERDGLAGALAVAGRKRGDAEPYAVVAVRDASPAVAARRAADRLRNLAIGKTLAYGGGHGPMLAAMLFGYRKAMDGEMRDAFRRVGIGHVLAISGLHVGLIVGLLWWLSGWAGWSARVRAAACLALALAYLGLSGGQVAAVRATFMACIYLGGIAWGRRSDMMNSLGAAAFFIILTNPSAPLDVSFQLSFTAVVFIYLALRRLPDAARLRVDRARLSAVPFWRRRIAREAASLVRLSIATWFGLFPIIALVFNQMNPVGLPLNIVVIPLMSIVLACGLLIPLLGWIPGASRLLCLPAELLTRLALAGDRLPGSSFPVHAPEPVWIALFYFAISLWLLRGMMRTPLRARRMSAAILVFAAIVLVGLFHGMRSSSSPSGGRIGVLPGRGMGVIVAEAPGGAIVLAGSFSRGGVNETAWLHSLHRGGTVAVVAVGAVKPDLATLRFHYPVGALAVLPVKKAEDGDGAVWTAVPGAPGVEYAASRDGKGALVWLAARTGGKTVCVAPRVSYRELSRRLEGRAPGYDAGLVCLGLTDRGDALPVGARPAGWVALGGRQRSGTPPRWFERRKYGALVLGDGLRGYDGKKWVELSEAE